MYKTRVSCALSTILLVIFSLLPSRGADMAFNAWPILAMGAIFAILAIATKPRDI